MILNKIYKRRILSLFIAVIFIFSLISSHLFILVSSADNDTQNYIDLKPFMTNGYIVIEGEKYTPSESGQEVYAHRNELYEVVLYFQENDERQFADDDTPMEFILPEGFYLPDDFSSSVDINMGVDGILKNNPITYDKEKNAVIVRWNTESYLFPYFTAASNAKFHMSIEGFLNFNYEKLQFEQDKYLTIKPIDKQNASVTKSGYYDPEHHNIEYTVTVTSEGSTYDLSMSDIMGTALIYNHDCRFDSESSIFTKTPVISNTGSTFSVYIPQTSDGDKLVFKYTADIDINNIAKSGHPTFEETGNTVTITGDSDPSDNTDTYWEKDIKFSDLIKNAVSVGRQYQLDGKFYRDISWQITTNRLPEYSLAGSYIKDVIAANVKDICSYTGNGIEVLCYDFAHQLKSHRNLTWEDINTDISADKSWTYNIPEDDPPYEYIINYKTRVDVSKLHGQTVISNTAFGKGGEDRAEVVVSPDGKGIGVHKKATDITSNHVTWVVTVSLSGDAFSRDSITLTEHSNDSSKDSTSIYPWENEEGKVYGSSGLPHRWIKLPDGTTILYKEQLEKIEIDGLYENETFQINYNGKIYEPGDTNFEHALYWDTEKLSINFFKNKDKSLGGLNKPENSDSRIITVKITDKFPEEWAQQAKINNENNGQQNNYLYEHINWADVEGTYNVDKFSQPPVGVYKKVLRGGTDKKINMVIDGHIYPVFTYQVLVAGVETDEPLVIEDTFDTSLFKWVDPAKYNPYLNEEDFEKNLTQPRSYSNWHKVYLGAINEFDWLSKENVEKRGGTIFELGEHDSNMQETSTGLRFTLNDIPKAPDGSYYTFYGVQYWLIPKDISALAKIETIASDSPGKVAVIPNTAVCRGESSTANVYIPPKNKLVPVDKSFVIDHHNSTVTYTVNINPAKMKLNNGLPTYAFDRYSDSISIDFKTINIVSSPPANISYDFSNHTGTFYIPDETHVIITYEARILGEHGQQVDISNDFYINGYNAVTSENVIIQDDTSGSASVPKIYLYKFGAGHMERGLNGAKFRLYEVLENGTHIPVCYGKNTSDGHKKGDAVVFTTDTVNFNPKDDNGNFKTNDPNKIKDGYAEIFLNEYMHGVTLKFNKKYALEEFETPVSVAPNGETITYKQLEHPYIFTIADNSSLKPDYSQYIYPNNDVLTVRNEPDSIGLTIHKSFNGNCAGLLTEAEKNQITFDILRKNHDGNYEYINQEIIKDGKYISVPNEHFRNIPYENFVNGQYNFSGLQPETGHTAENYIIIENINEDMASVHPSWNWKNSCIWSDGQEEKSILITLPDGSQKYGFEFTVTADDIRKGINKEVFITNTYSKETVDLYATKSWHDAKNNPFPFPLDIQVELSLYRINNNKMEFIKSITLDGHTDTNGENISGTAVFKNLQKYLDDGTTLIQYVVRETSADINGYDTVYTNTQKSYSEFTGNHTEIINKQKSTSISVKKQWQNAENKIPQNAYATFRLYSYTGDNPSAMSPVANINDITLTNDNWTATFSDIPQTDKHGHTLHYAVKEISCLQGYQAEYTQSDYALDKQTIINHPAVTDFSVTKSWTRTPNNDWFGDTNISLTLRRKSKDTNITDDSFSAVYTLGKNKVLNYTNIKSWDNSEIVPEWSCTNKKYTLSLSNLEKCDINGNEWVYYISENPLENFTATYMDKNKNDVTEQNCTFNHGYIINEQNVRNMTVSKTVTGNMGSTAKDFEFTLILQDFTQNNISCEKSDGTTSLKVQNGVCHFTLSHNEKIVIYIPLDTNYTLTEKNYSNEGYITSLSIDGNSPENSNTISGKMDNDHSVSYTNSNEGFVPTGINLSYLFPVLFLIASLLSVSVLIYRQKYRE